MDDSVIDDIVAKQQPNQCAVILYTVSGILIV